MGARPRLRPVAFGRSLWQRGAVWRGLRGGAGRALARTVLLALGLALDPAGVRGQAPLLEDGAPESGPREAVAADWKRTAAERALGSGLSVLAEGLFRELLGAADAETERAADLRAHLASALIAQGRFGDALGQLDAVPEALRGSAHALYRAAAVYGDGTAVDGAAFRAALERVAPDALSAADRPWWHLLRGLRAELEGGHDAAQSAYEAAVEAAVTPEQGAFFESLVMRQEILHSAASPELAAEIRGNLERLDEGDSSAAYAYAREYAIVLHNLGRTEEAIAAIDRELAESGAVYGNREREQLLLLRGMLLGPDSVSGRASLREIVRNGTNRRVMRVALQLLARVGTGPEAAEFSDFLNELIARSAPHPLLARLYYLRSQLAVVRGDTVTAEKDARFLLEQFPGMDRISDIHRLLAYAALRREPPRFRAAADALLRLRDEVEDPAERQTLNRLVGDCYFLNEDYANAVDFYRAARFREVGTDPDGDLFLRLVTAAVRAGQIEAALQTIDETDFSGSVAVADRWRAEWNVAQALQARGRLEEALERVRLLVEDGAGGAVPVGLDLRLRWLEARLALLAGRTEGVAERVDGLLERLDTLPEATLAEREARLLRTEILLLKAGLLMRTDAAEAGLELLGSLRDGFPESSAARRSYLVEANHHGERGDPAAAQATLAELAERYPESELAPQALYEAALYCERRGGERLEEAVRLHNTLAERYPDNPIVFYARIKQGDLLRELNDFAGAQTIYENLINNYPEHPRRHVAELSRADCMLALAKNNAERLEDAAVALERLLDMPNLPVDFQAEAGYKWGFALRKRDAPEEARNVLTLITSRFLLENETASDLGPTGRYWVSRALLDLGELLESAGEPGEARRVYRKVVAHNLPGRALARSRAERLRVAGAGDGG